MALKLTEEEKLGRRVRELRLRRGLSQEELAEPEYTAAYISHLEHGKRRASHEALTHVAGRLGMTYDQLVTGRDPDEDLRLEVETQRAIADIYQGDVEEALQALDDVQGRARKNGNDRAAQLAQCGVGLALYRLGRIEEAKGAYEKALALMTDEPPERRTTALVGRARCLLQSDEVDQAVHLLEDHLFELRRSSSPDPGCLVETYAALIPGYFEAGEGRKAKEAAMRGWELAPTIPDAEQRACLYINRAQLMLLDGESREALTSLALAEDVYRHLGWYSEAVKVRLAKSFVLTDQGQLKEAESLILEALEGKAAVGSADEILALTRLAHIRRRLGHPEEGMVHAKRALKLAGEAFGVTAAEALREAGMCARDLGDAAGAVSYWRKALKRYVEAEHHQEVAQTADLLANHLLATGDTKGALAVFKQGLGSMKELH